MHPQATLGTLASAKLDRYVGSELLFVATHGPTDHERIIGLSSPEQPPRQQDLHVASTIRDEINVHARANNPVNHAVWFKKCLAILTNT